MNQTPRPTAQTELDRLYSESGEVEPKAGLDRIVLARAEQALTEPRRRKRQPWLTGLATASVALVALAVVLQQSPPAPESELLLESTEADRVAPQNSDAGVAASATDVTGEVLDSARHKRSAAESRALDQSFEAMSPKPATPATPPAAPEARAETADEPTALRSITVTGSRISADLEARERAQDMPYAALFMQLRQLIEDGNPDAARALLLEAEQRDGRITLPEELERVLRVPNEPD